MKRIGTSCLILTCLLPWGGCDALPNPGGSSQQVTVSLVNNSDFGVAVVIYYDDEQLLPESVLTQSGTRLDFTVAAGATETFTRNCDDLQVIVVDDADLQVVIGLGPEANSNVLRDGTDFNCGDTIVFTFDHSIVLIDFDVTTDVR